MALGRAGLGRALGWRRCLPLGMGLFAAGCGGVGGERILLALTDRGTGHLLLYALPFLCAVIGLGLARRRRIRLNALREAVRLLRRDDHDKASTALTRYIERYSADLDRALLYLAVVRLKLNLLDEAVDAYSRMDPARCPIEDVYELATQAEARKLKEPALHLYRFLLARDKEFADVAERIQALTAPKTDEKSDPSFSGSAADLKQSIQRALPKEFGTLRLLGRGGMAVVFAAKNEKTGERLAVKVLDPRFLEETEIVRRFYRETIAISNLVHAGIPRVMAVKKEPLPHYVMEYVDGKSLSEIMAEKERLPAAYACEVALQVAEALGYAHARKVVHRDVKPSNIIITTEGKAKLLDFGIASIGVGTQITRTGQVLGTLQYMAPEQIKGEQTDARADVYALGVVLYVMVTGQLPFPSAAPYDRVYADPRHPKDVVPDLPAALTCVLLRCLERKREERYTDGDELAESLRAASERLA